MFRSSTIIRELVLNLAEVIFTSKHSVKLRRCMLSGDVAACHGAACVLCAVQNVTVCFNINTTLVRFSTSSLMIVVDRNM
jgi:hypothetical protein